MTRHYIRFLASVSIWGVLVFVAWAVDEGGAKALWSNGMARMIGAVAVSAGLSGTLFFQLWRRGGWWAPIAACLTTLGGVPCFLLLLLLAGAPSGHLPAWDGLLGVVLLAAIGNVYLLFHSLPVLIVWVVGSVLVEVAARPPRQHPTPPVTPGNTCFP